MSNPKFGTLEYEFEEAALLFSCSYGDGQQYQQADSQLLVTEQIPEGDPDLGGAAGFALKFIDGQTIKVCQDNNGVYYYFVPNQQPNWVQFPLEQKLHELQQQYPQAQAQQQPQNDQKNSQLTMRIVLIDFNKAAKYEGSLTSDYIIKETKDNFEIGEVFEHIKENIESALEKNQPIELSQGDFCTLKATLKIEKKNIARNFEIACKLSKVEIDTTEKEDIKTRYQNKMMNKLKKQLEDQEKIIQQLQQKQGGQQANPLQPQLQQKVQSLDQQIQQLQNSLEQANNQIQALTNTIQQLGVQAPKSQPKVISLEQLNQEQNGYKLSQIFQGFCEFRIVLLDHEVEFEIGILKDSDFENLEVKAGALFFEFPSGKFRRGSDDSERVVTYPFYKGTVISVKVDTQKHIIQLALNDFDFAPLTLPSSLEQFAFLFKITTADASIEDSFDFERQQH